MHILNLIVQNGTDASETLSPPGIGGNITEPQKVRQVFGGKLAMIGGMDQMNILTAGTKDQIRTEVARLFDGFGKDGGYIMSAADHFFDTPVENLQIYALRHLAHQGNANLQNFQDLTYAQAARECVY